MQGIAFGAISTLFVFFFFFSYHNLLELFDHNRLPLGVNVVFFMAHNYSHGPVEY